MFAVHLGKILVVESTDVNHTVVFFTDVAHFRVARSSKSTGRAVLSQKANSI